MANKTQDNSPIAVTTPLGKDKLLLIGISGQESISRLFNFQLEMLANNGDGPKNDFKGFEFAKLLGGKITVEIKSGKSDKRYINGLCSRVVEGEQDAEFTTYHLEVVPQFWLWTRKAQSRIFQQMSVPDILKKVLEGMEPAPSFELQGTFEKRDYFVQYRETDFNFACRLMEEEGIYFYFNHTSDGHKMVLSNSPQSHVDVPINSKLIYETVSGGNRPEERVFQWQKSQELRSGKYVLRDHSFELPDQNLEASEKILGAVQAGTMSHKLEVGGNEKLELFDFPGEYAQRFDGVSSGGGDQAGELQKIFDDKNRTVKIRIQEEASGSLIAHGASTCRQMVAGHKFSLEKHFNADGKYVLTTVSHSASLDSYRSGSQDAFRYTNQFTCQPLELPFRPARLTPKPVVQGTQTAVVVGPPGEEIWPDKYGRVKVKFRWDRDEKKDAKSSCWVRVTTMWAGKQWGMVHIPRIGQEVVVAFEEGDPDQPLIVGSVYNFDQMPPYKLPDNKTQSGLKSRSSKNASTTNFNELRFEDKKDSEQIYVHAEKNFDGVVENNETRKVGFEKKDKGDQTIEIFNNQVLKVGCSKASDGSQTIDVYKDRTETVETGNETVTIKKGNRSINVDTGNDTHTIKKGNRSVNVDTGNDTHVVKTGNRTVQIDKGNDTHQIKMGNRDVKIDMGNDALTIKMGNQTTKLKLGKSATEAMQGIELKVGQSSIKIDQMGVTIKGMMVKIEGQIQTEVKGLMTTVQGSAMTMVKGAITMIN